MSNIQYLPTPYSYSSAVNAGDFIFLGLHRGFGDTFNEQLRSTFANIQGTLGKYDLELDSIVKVNVWLKNIHDLPSMEKLFIEYFAQDHFPARMTSTTQFIDTDCLLMIDGVAYRG